jgi:CBS domain containing-hemolysin-like protein
MLCFALAALGVLVVALAAVGAKVLHEVPWHELEEHCRRQQRRDVFDAIHDGHDEAVLGVESVELLGCTMVLLSIVGGLVLAGPDRAAIDWRLLAAWGVAGAFGLLALGVWIPWAVARLWAAPFLYRTWPIWRLSSALMRPSLTGAHAIERLMRRLAGQVEPASQEEALEDEIRAIVTEGLHDGLLEADTREMIEGVIELGDADAADIMTPRSKMDAIPVGLGWTETMQRVIRFGRTRIPFYDETLDNILGILYVKDLLPELAKAPFQPRRSLREVLRTPWFVPKTRRVDDLLQDFLQTRNHMAIVVDEYMAVAGLVTIEDVIEEIVGEIVDESDKEHVGEIRPIDDRTAEVQGRAHLAEVNEQLALQLEEPEDFDTIGGLVVNRLGRIPKAGESLTVDNVRITVLEASRRKVERVRLELLKQTDREPA